MKKIIVTSAGRGAAINFCRSLRTAPEKYEIIGLESNKYSIMHAQTDYSFLSPAPHSPYYLEFLQETIKKSGADFLYPSKTDEELLIISNNREKLDIKTFLPSKKEIDLYENKFKTYVSLKKAGLKVPETILVKTREDLELFLLEHKEIWLRAISGSGGKGSVATDSLSFATEWIERFGGWGSFTAAEKLTSKTATWSAIWDNGKLVVSQIRERLYWEFSYLAVSGVTGITGAQVTKKDKRIDELAIKSIQSVSSRPHGIVSVDFCYDENGVPNPTEIQASRFYTSSFFMAAAGLNMPHIMIKTAFNERIPSYKDKFSPLPEGLVWIKYVDCEPVLTNLEAINKNEEKLLEWENERVRKYD